MAMSDRLIRWMLIVSLATFWAIVGILVIR